MMTFEKAVVRMGVAAAQFGKSMADAGEALGVFFGHFADTMGAIVSVADIIQKYKRPPDETLRELSIGREGHLLLYAKKGRTRKKYRNRLVKRYYNKMQIEEQTDEKSGTNY